MITEDYVSFETAKLLKDKGFDVPCNCYGAYSGVNLTYRLCITDKYTNWNKHDDKLIISCPTFQMTMKWLRDEYGIFIYIKPWLRYWGLEHERYKEHRFVLEGYVPHVFSIDNPKEYKPIDKYCVPTYEKACEAAIKYCLENLI